MPVRRLPLSYYVDLLERRVPFTYLSYGDGEFHAMDVRSGTRTMTNYEEVVTPEIAAEMRASLDAPGDDVIRGTDEFIVEPETYRGNDKSVIFEANRVAMKSIEGRKISWVDGTVWDEAVKNGLLGPLLKAINGRATLVGCSALGIKMKNLLELNDIVVLPSRNALSTLDTAERLSRVWESNVYLLCIGLSAIPLALRIRGKIPGATVIDLGSALDVFAGLGAERGWRKEFYSDPKRLKALIAKNLQGV